MARRPVLMLGLDAADSAVVDQLISDGEMPNLQRLRDNGLHGRLDTPADLYAGGVWPTFYTARDVPGHGVYHNKLWRAGRMRVDVADDDWLPIRPFWEWLDSDVRVCIVDVPMVVGAPRPVNGFNLAGWGTHDVLSRGSWPRELWADCERRFGKPAMPAEDFGRQSARALAALPDRLIEATHQLAAIAVDLMTRDQHDLTCVVFGAIHRAGHYLHDRSQLDGVHGAAAAGEHELPGDGRRVVAPDLLRVYRAVDDAIGMVLANAPASSLVLAFAAHGMGPNAGWSDLLPDMLAQLDEHVSGHAPRHGMLYRLKRRIPIHRARPLLQRLPAAVQHRLVSVWSRRMFDWSSTRSFPLPMDQAGYLRVNLRGRERDGIVSAGAEYDALCDELTALLLGLRCADTGRPIAARVVRAYALAAADAPGRDLLPDLVVSWSDATSRSTNRVVSAAHPGFVFDVPALLPSGRAGNHTDHAWFIASGPGVARGPARERSRVIDLVPTALRQLGAAVPAGIDGRPIDLTDAP